MKLVFLVILVIFSSIASVVVMNKSKPSVVKIKNTHERRPTTLKTTGIIPKWLNGLLVRNGPVNIEINGKTPHWFDGPGMLHSFTFNNGTITYTNKFLKSEAYDQVFEKGSLNYMGFDANRMHPLLEKITSWFTKPKVRNANVNVARFAEHYVALTETPLPVRFNPQTLETLGTLAYNDNLPQGLGFESAHPHYDNETKGVISYLINFGQTSEYIFYRMAKDSVTREVIARIPVESPSYVHTFAITENYITLVEIPFKMKPLEFIVSGKSFIKSFHWHPKEPTHFVIIDRKKGNVVKKIPTKAFFTFHQVNAFEEGENLIYDIICYEDISAIDKFKDFTKVAEGQNITGVTLERFTVSLASETVSFKVIANKPLEFPRINYNFNGRAYKYAYMVDPRDGTLPTEKRSLFKYTMTTGAALEWNEEGCFPGEPIFVSAPNSRDEDDGIVLAIVADYKKNNSFLLILDSKTFKEIGRAIVPDIIPTGLHGQYFSDKEPIANL